MAGSVSSLLECEIVKRKDKVFAEQRGRMDYVDRS